MPARKGPNLPPRRPSPSCSESRPTGPSSSTSSSTSDLRGQIVVLGSGTSVGVPAIGCDCSVCTSGHPKNQRTRCSIVLGLPEGNLLVDTTPEMRMQLLREKIGIIHAVAYTHEHADHLFGLDDLRILQFHLGHAVPLYCREEVELRIRSSFDYAFCDGPTTHPGAVPQLEFRRIDEQPFSVLGATVIPILLPHGPQFQVLGFRVGKVAYCTDVNGIPENKMPLLSGLDTLILDGLRKRPHPTHLSVDEAVAIAQRLKPQQTYLTHICHDLDHDTTNAELPDEIELAYDGLRIPMNM